MTARCPVPYLPTLIAGSRLERIHRDRPGDRCIQALDSSGDRNRQRGPTLLDHGGRQTV